MPATIGILAGMGPRSSSPFLELVLDECQRQYGAKYDIDYPPILLYSLPTPFFLDRELDHDLMERTILEGAQRLEGAGATFLAIPCNTAHRYIETLQKELTIPVLNIIEVTTRAIPGDELTTILATQSTIDSSLYQQGLEKSEIPYILREEWQKEVQEIIRAVKMKEIVEANKCWRDLLNILKRDHVRNVVLGCTELSLLPLEDKELLFIDSSAVLAREVVGRYCSVVEGTRSTPSISPKNSTSRSRLCHESHRMTSQRRGGL